MVPQLKGSQSMIIRAVGLHTERRFRTLSFSLSQEPELGNVGQFQN